MGKNFTYQVDIGGDWAIQRAMKQVEQNLGKLNIVVNSAGIVGPTSTKLTEYSVEDFDRMYSVNLRGSFPMTKYVNSLTEGNTYGESF